MDQELKAYLDEKFGQINTDFGRELQGLRGETGEQTGGLLQELHGFREETGQRFDKVETGLRHNGIEIEQMRGQIQLISEAVSGLDSRLTAFQGHATKELADLRGLLTTGFSMINDRVRPLELWRESLEPRSRPLISDQ
ncbi:MAG: hypothetical protein ACJ75H_05630 [Thermoanaerobaculia bacterium]